MRSFDSPPIFYAQLVAKFRDRKTEFQENSNGLDDEFLSSGGASPISDPDAIEDQIPGYMRPSLPSRTTSTRTIASVTSRKRKVPTLGDLTEDERAARYLGPVGKRWENVRVTSWADPKSALSEHEEIVDPEEENDAGQATAKTHKREDSLLGGDIHDEPASMDEFEDSRRRKLPSLPRYNLITTVQHGFG